MDENKSTQSAPLDLELFPGISSIQGLLSSLNLLCVVTSHEYVLDHTQCIH